MITPVFQGLWRRVQDSTVPSPNPPPDHFRGYAASREIFSYTVPPILSLDPFLSCIYLFGVRGFLAYLLQLPVAFCLIANFLLGLQVNPFFFLQNFNPGFNLPFRSRSPVR